MKALVLAAGYATRLYPLTKDKPKPLLPVGKKLILDHILQKINDIDKVDKIHIITNDKFYAVFDAWRETAVSEKEIIVDNDGSTTNENRLGAIGDIRLVIERHKISDALLIVAGDNVFDWALKDFVEFSRVEPGVFAVGVYDIKDKKEAHRYGVVEVDENGRLKNFLEKPQEPPSSLIATGIYYFPEGKAGLVTEYLNEGTQRDAPGHFVAWLLKRRPVRCYSFDGRWYDIGDIVSYQKADREFGG